jgi:hypothetical protein
MIWRAIVFAQLLVLDLAVLVWAFAAGPPEKDTGHLVIPVLLGMMVLLVSAIVLISEIVDDVRAWRAERRRQKAQELAGRMLGG